MMQQRCVFDPDMNPGEPDHLVEEIRAVASRGRGEMGHLVDDREKGNDWPGQMHDTVLCVGGSGRAPQSIRDLHPRWVDILGVCNPSDRVAGLVGVERAARHLAFAEIFTGINQGLIMRAVAVRIGTLGDLTRDVVPDHPISPRTPLVKERPDPPKDLPAL